MAALLFTGGAAFALAARQRHCLLEYTAIIRDIPAAAKEVRIWLPSPPNNAYQTTKDIGSQGPDRWQEHFDKAYGNKILFYRIKAPGSPVVRIGRTYEIRRYEFSNRPSQYLPRLSFKKGASAGRSSKYSEEDQYLAIPDEVFRLAAKITAGKGAAIDKARAIYDYLVANLVYDKLTPGWGNGDLRRVCLIKKGNCTDFHSFFIALCRASGVPAKFIMGVKLPEKDRGEIGGYHCWAEFYAAGHGWVPVDVSEAWKDRSKYEYFFGAVDEDRVEISEGRNLVLDPPQDGGPLNYFFFPYVEVDGEPFGNVEIALYYKNITGGGR